MGPASSTSGGSAARQHLHWVSGKPSGWRASAVELLYRRASQSQGEMRMDQVAVMKRVVEQTGAVVDGIREDQLGNATGCSEWTVRDIVNHITGGATMFSEGVEGPVADERLGQLIGGDNLGNDFKGSFHAAADKAVSTFDQPG